MAKHKGHKTGRSSADRIAPQDPYTGDGHTTRDIYDKPAVVIRDSDGKRIKTVKKD